MIESSGWPLRGIDWPAFAGPLARRRFALLLLAAAFAALAGAGTLIPPGSDGATRLLSVYGCGGAAVSVAALCLLRAVAGSGSRWAWALLGAAILAWGVSGVADAAGGGPRAPFPSAIDAGYLTFSVLVVAALALLARPRLHGFPTALLLDGAIAGMTLASLLTALGRPALIREAGGLRAVTAGFAFPALDAMILTVVLMVILLHGFRPPLDRTLIAAGIAVFALADSISVSRAADAHATGHPLAAWLLAAFLIGVAACLPPTGTSRDPAPEGWVAVIAPTALSFAALVLLTVGHLHPVGNVSMTLARATIAVAFVRLFVSFAANQRLLARSRIDAFSDELTGLGNRRALIADATALCHPAAAEPHVLAIYDLDGFKHYNDTFGHPAGDALLARLGARLEAAVAGRAKVYRLGGDEFCLLAPTPAADADALVAAASRGLVEEGARFAIRPSYGAAIIPTEAAHLTEALGLADRRMYAQKAARAPSPPLARDGRPDPS